MRAANFFAPRGADVDREQIWLGEIAIVVRFFFGAHRDGVAFVLIPEARLLRDAAAAFEHADVALDFVFERFLQEAEGVQIFHFDLGAELLGAAQADADVGVAAERAFFHVAVADAGVEQDLAERGEVGVGLFGRAHVGLGDDFGERGAAAVVVDVGLGGGLREAFVEIFGGVFFDVEARDADAFFCAGDFDFDVAAGGEREFELGDLVALGEVGVEIIFAGEAGVFVDGAVEGERGAGWPFR